MEIVRIVGATQMQQIIFWAVLAGAAIGLGVLIFLIYTAVQHINKGSVTNVDMKVLKLLKSERTAAVDYAYYYALGLEINGDLARAEQEIKDIYSADNRHVPYTIAYTRILVKNGKQQDAVTVYNNTIGIIDWEKLDATSRNNLNKCAAELGITNQQPQAGEQ